MKFMKGKIGISSSTLKLIAVFTMLIDHIGAGLLARFLVDFNATGGLRGTLFGNMFPWVFDIEKLYLVYKIMRGIGRIAFPIYCFLLVEGFERTRDIKKYLLRMGIFCIVSELPFDLCFKAQPLEFAYQNVFFTLFLGLLTMTMTDYVQHRQWNADEKFNRIIVIFLRLLVLACGMLAAMILRTDYAARGVVCIMVLYYTRNNRLLQCIAGAAAFLWEITAPVSFIPIYFYNGKRGLKLKLFFYIFYPVHLFLIYLLALSLGFGGVSPV